MNNPLLDALRLLPASGSQGFEGLISLLLESLTGQPFCLAKAGSQAGRDMSSRYPQSNVIAVECKRYNNSTQIKNRDLLGEIDENLDEMPDLDIWVLIASRTIKDCDQLRKALDQKKIKESVDIHVIADDDETPSSIEVLCAYSPEILINFFKDNLLENKARLETKKLQELEDFIQNIQNNNLFSNKAGKLKEKFLSPLIGYCAWRVEQNKNFIDFISSQEKSRSAFGQIINIKDKGTNFIERQGLSNELNNWFSQWINQKNIFTLTGEEGDGKTWGVAYWLSQQIEKNNNFPGVIFLSSQNVTINENIFTLLSESITNQLLSWREQQWEKRIDRWVKREIIDSPLMILVLDGINERNESGWWQTLIQKLSASPWSDHVGVIITCRSQYWKENFENLRYLKIQKYELSPYDEEELKRALHYCKLAYSNVENLVPLIYKPRYFDLTVKYYQEISESGDVTIARLIYEDWKDRLNRKNHLSLNDTEFQDFIRDLAREKYSDKEEKYIDKDLEFKPKEIQDNLPFKEKKEKIFEDIKTERIVRKKNNGRYCVDEKFLTYGFGLLLVSELESLHENLLSESKDEKINSRTLLEKLGEAIASWLEPNAGMDIKAEICQFAFLIAFGNADISLQIRISLLSAWINNQNPRLDSNYEFISYLPQDPEPYIHLAPIFWLGNNQNPWGQELLMRGLLKWKDKPSVCEKLTEAIQEWLSLVNIYGFPSQRHQIKDVEEIHTEINQRVGFSITENFDFCNYKFIAIADDGWMRLSRFALALISSLSRKSFISAITQGCLAEAIMGNTNKYELFRWVIITSPESLWEEIWLKADHLLELNNSIAQLAAHRLLSFEGSKEAYKLQQSIPENVLPVNPWRAEYEKDPCRSGISWDRKTCETCLERDDLQLHWIAQNLQKHCLDPSLNISESLRSKLPQLLNHISVESIWSRLQQGSDDHNFNQYEPVLCAYSADEFADFVKLIFTSITQRQISSLHYLQFHICEHYILFDSIQENSIWKAWLQIYQKSYVVSCLHENKLYKFLSIFKNWFEVDNIAESFLFKSLVKYLTADVQFCLLLIRPQEAKDLLDFENHFKSLELSNLDNECLSRILNQENKVIQRFLWFIAPFAKNISTNILNEHIVPLVKNDTSFTRATSLCVIYKSENNDVIQQFIKEDWQWHNDYHFQENHWASLILSKFARELSYQDLCKRIFPTYLGYAILCRGMKADEIDHYATCLHEIWLKVLNFPSLPDDFPHIEVPISEDFYFVESESIYLSDRYSVVSQRWTSEDYTWGGLNKDTFEPNRINDVLQGASLQTKLLDIMEKTREEQEKLGNYFFCQIVPKEVLREVIKQQPSLIDQWLQPIQPQEGDASQRIIHLTSTFYEVLCSALLGEKHEKSIDLYNYLSKVDRKIILKLKDTNIEYLDYSLF